MEIAEQIFFIGSGKGGVGKSTVAVNLSVAMALKGFSVGLLDADVYGPSLPIMMGLRGLNPRTHVENGKEWIIPFTKFGVRTMSIGFFLEEAQSIVWRGPRLHSILQKMLLDVSWGKLDLLLIDLPPGTGDVLVTLSQLLNVRKALIVTTPQEVALVDAIKALNAFDQLQIPLAGIIENMAGLKDAASDTLSFPFGKGRGEELARRFGAPLLKSLPLLPALCEAGDLGIPPAFQTNSLSGVYFQELAQNFLSTLK